MAVFRDTEPEHYPLALTLALTAIRYGEATATVSPSSLWVPTRRLRSGLA
jgi:hypothetical protein